MLLDKISVIYTKFLFFGKMQRGRYLSFELSKLDTYCLRDYFWGSRDIYVRGTNLMALATVLASASFTYKKINIVYNFQTRGDEAFKLYMCFHCNKTFHMVP